jgi:hypothetical protein
MGPYEAVDYRHALFRAPPSMVVHPFFPKCSAAFLPHVIVINQYRLPFRTGELYRMHCVPAPCLIPKA